jgi:hypothetical protein
MAVGPGASASNKHREWIFRLYLWPLGLPWPYLLGIMIHATTRCQLARGASTTGCHNGERGHGEADLDAPRAVVTHHPAVIGSRRSSTTVASSTAAPVAIAFFPFPAAAMAMDAPTLTPPSRLFPLAPAASLPPLPQRRLSRPVPTAGPTYLS